MVVICSHIKRSGHLPPWEKPLASVASPQTGNCPVQDGSLNASVRYNHSHHTFDVENQIIITKLDHTRIWYHISSVWKHFTCQLLSYWYTFYKLNVHILEIPIVHIILYCILTPFSYNYFNHLFNLISWHIYLVVLPTYLLFYLYPLIALVFLSIVLFKIVLYFMYTYGLFVRNKHTTTYQTK